MRKTFESFGFYFIVAVVVVLLFSKHACAAIGISVGNYFLSFAFAPLPDRSSYNCERLSPTQRPPGSTEEDYREMKIIIDRFTARAKTSSRHREGIRGKNKRPNVIRQRKVHSNR